VNKTSIDVESPVFARSATSDARLIGVVCVGHCLSHFYSLVLPPLFPVLRRELGESYAALGALITTSAGASAISQPISGFLVDRFGARSILAGGLALLSTAIALAGLVPSYGALVLSHGHGGTRQRRVPSGGLLDFQREGRSAPARPRI
jgi:MFS family permease